MQTSCFGCMQSFLCRPKVAESLPPNTGRAPDGKSLCCRISQAWLGIILRTAKASPTQRAQGCLVKLLLRSCESYAVSAAVERLVFGPSPANWDPMAERRNYQLLYCCTLRTFKNVLACSRSPPVGHCSTGIDTC